MRLYENVTVRRRCRRSGPFASGSARAQQARSGGACMNVIGISGSLRKGSFNSAALRVAQGLVPEGMTIERAEIGDLPLYNDDVRAAGFPPPAERLRAQIAAADAVLLVTPEFIRKLLVALRDWTERLQKSTP